MTSAMPLDFSLGVVRIFLPDEAGVPLGHIAVVTESDNESSMMVKTVTTAKVENHRVETGDQDTVWSWLQDLEIKVAFLESKRDQRSKRYFQAKVLNWDLNKFLLYVLWVAPEPSDDPDWISLVDDEWSWIQGDRPPQALMKECFKKMRAELKLATQPSKQVARAQPPKKEHTQVRQPKLPQKGQQESLVVKRPKHAPEQHQRRVPPSDEQLGERNGPENVQDEQRSGRSLGKPGREIENFVDEEFSEERTLRLIREEGGEAERGDEDLAMLVAAATAIQSGSPAEIKRAGTYLRSNSTNGGLKSLVALQHLGILPLLVHMMVEADDHDLQQVPKAPEATRPLTPNRNVHEFPNHTNF